jgi:hypothetical protein
MTITLRDLLSVDNPERYKVHLACRNEEAIRPLDLYVTSRQNSHGWNQWRRK